MGKNLLEELAELLKCEKRCIFFHLKNPYTRNSIMDHLYNKVLRTTFLSDEGKPKIFYFQQFSQLNAANLKPYENLRNMNICEYYLKFYKIHLIYPHFPCVIDFTRNQEFYPCELLEIIDVDYIAYMNYDTMYKCELNE